MLKINEIERIYLGIQGENNARTITIDVSAWINLYPNGSVTIWHKRNGDESLSPTGAVYDADTKTISWSPTSTDTYVFGEGSAEFRLTDTNVIKKSKEVITGVSPSVTLAGTTLGSDWQSYINAVDGLRAAAVTAKEAAEDAQEDAEDAAEDAEAWAVGQRGGEDVESTDPTYHNNSKYYAEAAADEAGDAATAKNDAVSAKNAAVSAKVDAEAAKIAAETAKTAAQTAQAAAEAAAQSAAGQAVALIDDTAGSGTTNKTWSANKILSNRAPKDNPVFTGSISMHTKNGATTGTHSVTLGFANEASGAYSLAEGSATTASGAASHAEGYHTEASNSYAHAEGSDTTASGYFSHAEGYYTEATHRSHHVFGEYNVADDSEYPGFARGNYIEIVGNGTSSNEKSNARTLDWSGNEILAGDLTVLKGTANETSVSSLKSAIDVNEVTVKLLESDIPGTTTTVTMDSNGNPVSIVHTANNEAVRTDTFVWGTDTVTETRTLADGKYITIQTDLITLETVISDVQEVE